MKLTKLFYGTLALSVSMMVACSGMNDSIDPYLSRGEIIYIAKSDSVHLFAGNKRFRLDFWMSDPRATELHIYWMQRSDSIVVPIAENHDGGRIEVMVGSPESPLEQGNYTLELVTYDKHGNKSIVDEHVVNVYGTYFMNMVLPKFIKSAVYQAATGSSSECAKIVWGGSVSEREIGVNLKYKILDGSNKKVFYKSSELKNAMVLTDADLTAAVEYQTLYLPEPLAIDTFKTEYLPITITGLPN